MSTLRAKESFTAYVRFGKDKDAPVQAVAVAAGELLDSSHPTVKGREHLFVPVEEYVANPGRKTWVSKADKPSPSEVLMERATADPDEKRTVRPTRATVADKAADKAEEKDEKPSPTRGLRTGDRRPKQDGEV
jgi:hypothetical protein